MASELTFWRNKRVFLTGHTGFKGGWLALWLQKLGAEVHGYALSPTTEPNLFTSADINLGMAGSEIADIRDADRLLRAIKTTQAEIVFHLAAQPLVRLSYAQPAETYAINVMGTVNLLEAVRASSTVKAVVNITSDKCYENREWLWGYRENEAMGGFDPYSSSKGCAELITSAYRRSFLTTAGIAIASARAGNVIGGGDWAEDRLVPDILRAIGADKPALIRCPTAIRPWQHVLEPLAGYLNLAQKLYEHGGQYAEAWNFGPNREDARSVQWIVEQLTRQWGNGATWSVDKEAHPHEAHHLALDCSKARNQLDWQPRWTLQQALEKICVWHRAQRQGKNMRDFSLAQINDYQEHACSQ